MNNNKRTLLEEIIAQNAVSATNTLTKALREKTRMAIHEARKQVAVEIFGSTDDELIEAKKLDAGSLWKGLGGKKGAGKKPVTSHDLMGMRHKNSCMSCGLPIKGHGKTTEKGDRICNDCDDHYAYGGPGEKDLDEAKKLDAGSLWKGLGGKKGAGKKPVTSHDLMGMRSTEDLTGGKIWDKTAPKKDMKEVEHQEHRRAAAPIAGKKKLGRANWDSDERMPWPKDYNKTSYRSGGGSALGQDFKKTGHGAVEENENVNEELIHGKKLTPDQHNTVLRAYVHRHTGEHKPTWASKKMPNGNSYKPTHKTDKDWVHDHAFHFKKGTSQLSGNHKYAEPGFMAEAEKVKSCAKCGRPVSGGHGVGKGKKVYHHTCLGR